MVKRTAVPIRLKSVHYDRQTLQDLIEVLERHSTNCKIRIEVRVGNTVRAFSNMDDLFRESLLPDRLENFDIHLDAGEGQLLISTSRSGQGNEHVLMISGDDDWYPAIERAIIEFTDFNEASGVRSRLYGSRIVALYSILGAGLIWINFKYVLPWFGIPIYYDMPLPVLGMNVFVIGIVLAVEIYNRTFPYAAIIKGDSNLKLSWFFDKLIVISAIVSILWIAYQVYTRIL